MPTKPRASRIASSAPAPQDMLIALYALPTVVDRTDGKRGDPGIEVRAPLAPEHDLVVAWVARHFTPGWASEVRAALAQSPCCVVIAVDADRQLLGFCCRDAIARGFVGPVGVVDAARRRGVGAAVLRASLERMRHEGYAYAVAGAVGAPEFFARVAGATPIADSWPGLYRGMLRP